MKENTETPGKQNLIVDEPIINSPYEEPRCYWHYNNTKGVAEKQPIRRPANYYLRTGKSNGRGRQLNMFVEEEMVTLGEVNNIRENVRKWRESGYPNVTQVTRQLIRHWTDPQREPGRKLFFCQLEAVETLIWLKEIRRENVNIPKDMPANPDFFPLPRYCMKMATGTGKTVVMAMVIAWSVLNRIANRRIQWCSDAILIVTPNLTVKERLGGVAKTGTDEAELERALIPGAKGNYYDRFDLVPPKFMENLGQAKIYITNWHQFAEVDDSRKKSIIQRGKESDQTFADRVLKNLGSARNILVINDEAHHAWRPAPADEDQAQRLSTEEKAEKETATIWISGLDKINKARKIGTVVDLSATPYYIQGSGYAEGSPFPWIISDFGLVDAIESGIVKIPQMPVGSDSANPEPEYFALWKWINEKLSPAERGTATRKPKPEAVLKEAEGALKQIAGEWKKDFEKARKKGNTVPPVLIVVCDNTDIAQQFHEFISGERWEEYKAKKGKNSRRKVYGNGGVFPELLSNTPEREYTIRIDSQILNSAESQGEIRKQDAAEILRKKVATVGKIGEPGQDIRCVISVSMLTEGWDARNVTQILGVRAFLSQLLCEQVVGRGLRRTQYDDMSVAEYVDVYGIPFEIIPVKKKPVKPQEPPETVMVKALEEREELTIRFPRVEGFIYQVKKRIQADISQIEIIKIDPNIEPTETVVKPLIGYQMNKVGISGPGRAETQTRAEYYRSTRFQQIHYEIANRITTMLLNQNQYKMQARPHIFPQVLQIVREFTRPVNQGGRIDYSNVDQRELGLEKYVQGVTERLVKAIRPDTDNGESPLLPRLERFRPYGSSREVLFRTARPTKPTLKSHVNRVVLDNKRWEGKAAYYLEQSERVFSYVKNDHLGLSIEYEFGGSQHIYLPDFVVKLANKEHLVLEIKGYEPQQDKEKYEAAKRWCEAVTNWGEMGAWHFAVCKDPDTLAGLLEDVINSPNKIFFKQSL